MEVVPSDFSRHGAGRCGSSCIGLSEVRLPVLSTRPDAITPNHRVPCPFFRDALQGSPLSDLHLIAAEVGLDGYRRLRKADLVDAILAKVPGGDAEADAPAGDDDAADEAPKRRTRSRGGRGRRTRDSDDDTAEASTEAKDEEADEPADKDKDEERPARTRSRSTRSRSRSSDEPAAERAPSGRRGSRDGDDAPAERRGRRAPEEETGPEKTISGTLEVLGNGSGFLRVAPPEPSDDDVYVSAAQIRRCELVGGDVVSGPVRPQRRSESYPTLERVDTINDRYADQVSEGTPYDALAAAFPTELRARRRRPDAQAISGCPRSAAVPARIAGAARGKTRRCAAWLSRSTPSSPRSPSSGRRPSRDRRVDRGRHGDRLPRWLRRARPPRSSAPSTAPSVAAAAATPWCSSTAGRRPRWPPPRLAQPNIVDGGS